MNLFDIEWTQGAIWFYGGIAGMAAVLVIGIITVIIFSRGKARLTKRLDDEYGAERKND